MIALIVEHSQRIGFRLLFLPSNEFIERVIVKRMGKIVLGFVVVVVVALCSVEVVAESNNLVNGANECRQCRRVFHLNSEQKRGDGDDK